MKQNTIHTILILLLALILTQRHSFAQSHFKLVPDQPVSTAAHSAVALQNGNILVTGGYGKLFGKLPLVSYLARIYDQNTNTWRLTRGGTIHGRLNHHSLLLPNGSVILAGGISQKRQPIITIERFDPKTETFHPLPDMLVPRMTPCLNLLPDNQSVLITGAGKHADILSWQNTPDGTQYTIRPAKNDSHIGHYEHTTVTLPDGSILLIAGRTTHIERFDPATEEFSLYKSRLPGLFDDQAAALLATGNILIVGGQNIATNKSIPTTWLFNPKSDTLTLGPKLTPTSSGKPVEGASDVLAVDLFANTPSKAGRYIFLAGGEHDPGKSSPNHDQILDSAFVYSTATNSLTPVGPMHFGHDDSAAAILPIKDNLGRILITAGNGAHDQIHPHTELFLYDPTAFK